MHDATDILFIFSDPRTDFLHDLQISFRGYDAWPTPSEARNYPFVLDGKVGNFCDPDRMGHCAHRAKVHELIHLLRGEPSERC